MVDFVDRLNWLHTHYTMFLIKGWDLSYDPYSEFLPKFFKVVWAIKDPEICVQLGIEYNHRRWLEERDLPIHFPAIEKEVS